MQMQLKRRISKTNESFMKTYGKHEVFATFQPKLVICSITVILLPEIKSEHELRQYIHIKMWESVWEKSQSFHSKAK